MPKEIEWRKWKWSKEKCLKITRLSSPENRFLEIEAETARRCGPRKTKGESTGNVKLELWEGKPPQLQ